MSIKIVLDSTIFESLIYSMTLIRDNKSRKAVNYFKLHNYPPLSAIDKTKSYFDEQVPNELLGSCSVSNPVMKHDIYWCFTIIASNLMS